jgi:nucleotide-binding universal stress UspA family protein
MTNRVLVAIDGTEASKSALEIACALADNYEANLGLLCVVEPDQITDDLIKGAIIEGKLKRPSYKETYRSVAWRGRLASELGQLIAQDIVAEANSYSKDSAAKVIKTFVRSGDVAEEILDVAKENNADFIIMGHDQRGRLEGLIKSSVANKVVREAPCPCLIYCLPKQD